MDRGDGLFNARAFAETAYTAELDRLTLQYQEMLAAKANELAAKGTVLSGTMVHETARINGERITRLLRARLGFLLEGYQLYGVELDDHLSTVTLEEIKELREKMIAHSNQAYASNSVTRQLVKVSHYTELLQKHIEVSENTIKTDIARERRMKKPSAAVSNIYHVYGHNARWVTNCNDHSVNSVTVSSEQVFANLRQEIESRVPAGEEKTDILERLRALEQDQGSPSFSRRYAEFVSAAANHMQLIGPFIPALTELLHRAL